MNERDAQRLQALIEDYGQSRYSAGMGLGGDEQARETLRTITELLGTLGKQLGKEPDEVRRDVAVLLADLESCVHEIDCEWGACNKETTEAEVQSAFNESSFAAYQRLKEWVGVRE